jgi:hypothetical protein
VKDVLVIISLLLQTPERISLERQKDYFGFGFKVPVNDCVALLLLGIW